jgi:hypothetical protein
VFIVHQFVSFIQIKLSVLVYFSIVAIANTIVSRTDISPVFCVALLDMNFVHQKVAVSSFYDLYTIYHLIHFTSRM